MRTIFIAVCFTDEVRNCLELGAYISKCNYILIPRKTNLHLLLSLLCLLSAHQKLEKLQLAVLSQARKRLTCRVLAAGLVVAAM